MEAAREQEHEVAGYRVLRRIARGARTTVLLAHGGEPARTVVLKVAAADDPGALREAAALDRGAGEHVMPLLDAAADDERIVLVLPRLAGDLSRLMAERAEFEGGEAVTILAPIAATIRRLHAAGVAHGALAPAAVLFDGEGAPVLTGFGAAVVFAEALPEVELERLPEVAADRAGLREIASVVLGRVGGARRSAAQALLAQVRAVPAAEVAGRIAGGIFEVAAALPIRAVDPAPASSGGRIVPVAALVEAPAASTGESWAARVERWLDSSPVAEAKAVVVARWRRLSTGRRRIALGGAAGLLALVVALVAIPGAPAPGAAGTPTSSRTTTPRATASSRAETSASSVRDASVRGDDPVAAAAALLSLRASCRRELSVLCLDGVDQDGSSASDIDRDAIRTAQSGGELAPDPLPAPAAAAPSLTERIGGSALVALAGGASLLLVRTADGWRIRDLLTPPAQTPTPPPGG